MQLVVLWFNFEASRYNVFYWFCNHTPLMFSLAFFYGKDRIIKAIINLGFLPQILWTVDFLMKIFFGFYTFGFTRYVFDDALGIYVLVPILIHMFSTNVAFIATIKKKVDLKILMYSVIYVVLLYGITLVYSAQEINVNCVYEMCGAENYTPVWYTSLWPLIVFVFVLLPTQGIQYFFYWWFAKKKKHRR